MHNLPATVSVSLLLSCTLITAFSSDVNTRLFTLQGGDLSSDELQSCLLSCMEDDCEAVSLSDDGDCHLVTNTQDWHPESGNIAAYDLVVSIVYQNKTHPTLILSPPYSLSLSILSLSPPHILPLSPYLSLSFFLYLTHTNTRTHTNIPPHTSDFHLYPSLSLSRSKNKQSDIMPVCRISLHFLTPDSFHIIFLQDENTTCRVDAVGGGNKIKAYAPSQGNQTNMLQCPKATAVQCFTGQTSDGIHMSFEYKFPNIPYPNAMYQIAMQAKMVMVFAGKEPCALWFLRAC